MPSGIVGKNHLLEPSIQYVSFISTILETGTFKSLHSIKISFNHRNPRSGKQFTTIILSTFNRTGSTRIVYFHKSKSCFVPHPISEYIQSEPANQHTVLSHCPIDVPLNWVVVCLYPYESSTWRSICRHAEVRWRTPQTRYKSTKSDSSNGDPQIDSCQPIASYLIAGYALVFGAEQQLLEFRRSNGRLQCGLLQTVHGSQWNRTIYTDFYRTPQHVMHSRMYFARVLEAGHRSGPAYLLVRNRICYELPLIDDQIWSVLGLSQRWDKSCLVRYVPSDRLSSINTWTVHWREANQMDIRLPARLSGLPNSGRLSAGVQECGQRFNRGGWLHSAPEPGQFDDDRWRQAGSVLTLW